MNRRAGLALLLLAPAPLAAQGLDRGTAPELTDPPAFRAPSVGTATLPNGIRLYVVELREVPLVQVSVAVEGGSRLDGEVPGLASFTAGMLDEGAGSRDAVGIASEVAYLGASLFSGASWDANSVSLRAPKRTLEPALDLLADVLFRPTFPAAEVARQRDLRIAQIIQQRDQPGAVANLAFNSLVFPAGHPYHRPSSGDSSSVASFDSAMVRGFYERSYRPDRARIIVTGDITLGEAEAALSRRLGGWRGASVPAAVARGGTAAAGPSRIYLIDKPGAAQSVIIIGNPGIERSDPDYFAIEVMNTILGGSFSSRLNTILRETKGYSYGARSGFSYRRLPGPFTASSQVRTDVTDSSLVEFFREFRRIRDEPVGADELARAKAYLALGLAADFETTGQVAGQLGELLAYDLPLDWHNTYVQRVMAVTAADVQRVAQRLIRPEQMTITVVGDVAAIREGVERLGLAPLELYTP